MVLVSMQAIVSGFLFWVCGTLKYTAVVEQVPHSIVGGFVASCGAGLWKAALKKVSNLEWSDEGFLPKDWAPLADPCNFGLVMATFLMFLLLKTGPKAIQ